MAMTASIKATLATLIAMLIVGFLFKTVGLFENFRSASFYVAAILLGLLGAFVWVFVYKKG
jgi:chromate transport protein ChrA